MSLWTLITENSTLPVAPGNTFWDHLNSQQVGTGQNIYLQSVDVNVSTPKHEANLVEPTYVVTETTQNISISIENPNRTLGVIYDDYQV